MADISFRDEPAGAWWGNFLRQSSKRMLRAPPFANYSDGLGCQLWR